MCILVFINVFNVLSCNDIFNLSSRSFVFPQTGGKVTTPRLAQLATPSPHPALPGPNWDV